MYMIASTTRRRASWVARKIPSRYVEILLGFGS